MRTIARFAVALALLSPAIAAADPCECRPRCPCSKSRPLNFGVDTTQLGKQPAEARIDPRVVKLLEEWQGFPDEIRTIAFWGAVMGGGLAIGFAVLLIMIASHSGKTE